MSTYPEGRALPGAAFTLLAIAVLLLWIGFLLGLLAFIWVGLNTGLRVFSLFGTFRQLEGVMQIALVGQMVIQICVLLVIWALGSAVIWAHLRGATERAAVLAIWLIRLLIVFAVLHVVAAGAVGYAGAQSLLAGAITALPAVPSALVSIAFLICAEAYLRRPSSDVFE